METVRTVRDLLRGRELQLYTISPQDTVFDALQEMARRNVGALPVMEGDNLVGIFSERDYARKVILHGRSSKEMAVSEIMSTRVAYVRPNQTIDDCMALMTRLRIRHLPVIDEDKVTGMVSMRDVVEDIITEKDFIIEQLVNYIQTERSPVPPVRP
ncbi:MAG: CBS domain-containing protein [Anaerolineaceae bacterium]|nr:CBS domain-containing protein [Anaerolineaceae bacterium]